MMNTNSRQHQNTGIRSSNSLLAQNTRTKLVICIINWFNFTNPPLLVYSPTPNWSQKWPLVTSFQLDFIKLHKFFINMINSNGDFCESYCLKSEMYELRKIRLFYFWRKIVNSIVSHFTKYLLILAGVFFE
jgi:hypothetical protein